MLTRRSFWAGITLLGISTRLTMASDDDPINFDQDLIFPPLDEFKPYGYSQPTSEETTITTNILGSVPTGPSPYAVANWFATKPDKHYIAQWPKSDHWNPVIVEFFKQGTGLKVSNDMVEWCAAFVNYCLVQSGRAGTLNPSSQSFLPDYKPKVPGSGKFEVASTPRQGDIVVFTCHRADNDEPLGLGHVGFLSSASYTPGDTHVHLLAGNTAGNGTYSSIADKQVPVELKMSRGLGNGTRLPVILKLNSILSVP